MNQSKDTKQILWDWRSFFNAKALEMGEYDDKVGKVHNFLSGDNWAKCVVSDRFRVEVRSIPTTYAQNIGYPDWRSLNTSAFSWQEDHFSNYYNCSCSQGVNGVRCRHLASLLFHWEKQHGPFIISESETERAERLERERKEIEARLEKERLEKEKQEKEKKNSAVKTYLKNKKLSVAPDTLYFHPDHILEASKIQTNHYEMEIADGIIASGAARWNEIKVDYDGNRTQILNISGRCTGGNVDIVLGKDGFRKLSCACCRSRLQTHSYWYTDRNQPSKMCGHALVIWMDVRERLIRENPGDETDYDADKLLSILSGEVVQEKETEETIIRKKKQDVCLIPRIVREKNSSAVKLSFDIGKIGGKTYAVKGLENFVKTVENGGTLDISKNQSISFSDEEFTEDSLKWYQLITSRVRAVNSVNSRLKSGYYYSSPRGLSVGTGIPLEESDLDVVYDMAGDSILFQYDGRNDTALVRVGEVHPKVEIRLDPVKRNGRLIGIQMSGSIPRFLHGSLYQYVLDKECFGRVNANELAILKPFRAIESLGEFKCTIGEKKYAEFYYRILPRFQEAEQIDVIDHVGSMMDVVLPPEPKFKFYLDVNRRIICRATVKYDDEEIPLGFSWDVAKHLDRDQEERVCHALQRFFPMPIEQDQIFITVNSEETLLKIMTDGVSTLSQFGQVMGSDAFKRINIRPTPSPKVSVRIDGGLLDLSIQTKDLTEDELLDLLSSYRLKKRWHRLKNGDFVDLHDVSALQELDETAQAINISLEDLIAGKAHLPKFRALYVDKMLESHEDLASSRDRQFKALVRSFQTIKDSDFDAPEGLVDILRPYQTYGFRWLSTLGQYGFGGILADEMGLGKTLQMLAFIESQKAEKPALVVCPASLVYNWREECRRFTSGMEVETIAGTLSQRKAQIMKLHPGLYITSYDLLKRDITLYDGLEFSTIVLDEAQYIKNQKAAVSKAVRILNGEHRFALTGTPIENRLSELWSIFDYLMPGFLYTSSEFAERYETPIMKGKDPEATKRLAAMTEPFILRRKKEDVLKDLPEKLEETQSTVMGEEQRKLYDAQVVRMRELLDASSDSGQDKMRILAEITRLRQICCDPSLLFDDYKGTSAKRDACLELIQNAIDAGHRMLLFSQFTSMLALLAEDLKKAGIEYYTITGATPKQERVKLVNDFNSGNVPVFLISLKAGGTGLNLTGADVVIHYDPWWNIAVQNQATDRAHRIGQTRQVTVVKLIAAETIEERIVKLQETKRDLAEAIIGGQDNNSLMSMTKEELLALIG